MAPLPLAFSERIRSLFRRLGAMAYDTLLLAGLMIVPTVLMVIARGDAVPAGDPTYQALLVLLVGAFYVASWTRRRQTLGMRAWQLEVRHPDGRSLNLITAVLRLAACALSLAPFGAGYLWIAVDREGKAWHDHLTNTVVCFTPNA